MNNMIWDAVLWLRKKLNRDKEDIIQAVNNIQNLFETSVDATASASDIMEGKTAYNGTALLIGIIKDRRGVTVTAGTVTRMQIIHIYQYQRTRVTMQIQKLGRKIAIYWAVYIIPLLLKG